jgi:predicted nucleic acid-binding protein
MAEQSLTPLDAWRKVNSFVTLAEVRMLNEPAGLDDPLLKFCDRKKTSPNMWTDAYLASFAKCAGLRLVTFDS